MKHRDDYANCDHRSGNHMMRLTALDRQQLEEYREECRGRRRLLLLTLAAWTLAGAALALFLSL